MNVPCVDINANSSSCLTNQAWSPARQVGNSGNTTGAHLHFQVTDGNSALAAEGIPFIFDKFRFLGFGKDFEEDHHSDLPRSQTLAHLFCLKGALYPHGWTAEAFE
jgi:hypothetical protein